LAIGCHCGDEMDRYRFEYPLETVQAFGHAGDESISTVRGKPDLPMALNA
jgi:hypothetical protein